MDRLPRKYKQRLYDRAAYKRYRLETRGGDEPSSGNTAAPSAVPERRAVPAGDTGDGCGTNGLSPPASLLENREETGGHGALEKTEGHGALEKTEGHAALEKTEGHAALDESFSSINRKYNIIKSENAPETGDGQPDFSALGSEANLGSKNAAGVYEEIIYSYDVMAINSGSNRTSRSDDSNSDQGSTNNIVSIDPHEFYRISKIIEFVRGQIDRNAIFADTLPSKKGRRKADSPGADERTRTGSKGKSHIETAYDPRYLHFLKKVCGIGKAGSLKYLKEQQKHLNERNRKNKAELPEEQAYRYEARDDSIKIVASRGGADAAPSDTVVLDRMRQINHIKPLKFDMVDFEYAVYKYQDDFKKLSELLGLSLRDSILAYYLNINKISHMSHSLIETIIKRDWSSENDKLLFDLNYRRFGKKFWKYQIHRSEKDLRIYYKHYTRSGVLSAWSSRERALFASSFTEFKKDWGRIGSVLPSKSVKDLKIFYNEYFKKLSAEEKDAEMLLKDDVVKYDGQVAAMVGQDRIPNGGADGQEAPDQR